jgi:hypothetical protein
MEKLKKYGNLSIVAAISFFIGYYVLRPKPEIREKIKYVKVEVEKTKTKKTTKVKETKKPDGTTERETTVVEDSSTQRNESISSSKEVISKQKRGVIVGVSAIKDLAAFQENTIVGANIAVPLIGNLFVTGMADTSKRVGLGIALEF